MNGHNKSLSKKLNQNHRSEKIKKMPFFYQQDTTTPNAFNFFLTPDWCWCQKLQKVIPVPPCLHGQLPTQAANFSGIFCSSHYTYCDRLYHMNKIRPLQYKASDNDCMWLEEKLRTQYGCQKTNISFQTKSLMIKVMSTLVS